MAAYKASFTLSRCTPRWVPAVCSRRTGANRDESGRNSSAFIHSRQCYGPDPVLGKKWSRSVPVMLRFATVHSRCSPGGATVCPDTPRLCPGHRRQSPGVTTASDGSRTAKPRCYTVAYEYQWNSRGTYKRYVICKVQKSSYILRQKRTAIRVVEKIGNVVINKTLTFYTRLSLIKKLLRIIQINWLKI